MSDYIKREDAYEVLNNLYHHKTETQEKSIVWMNPDMDPDEIMELRRGEEN